MNLDYVIHAKEVLTMETIARMKTVEQCFTEIKKLDPDTAISQWFIRCLCKENKVKHFLTGNKILVNYDNLLCYLNNGFG